jgi:hypothetical protein
LNQILALAVAPAKLLGRNFLLLQYIVFH